MKKGIHPQNRVVVFRDSSTQTMFLMQSTVKTKEKIQYSDGEEYPLYDVEISSATHPFFTGTQKFVDTAGRVERFNRRYQVGDIHKKEKK